MNYLLKYKLLQRYIKPETPPTPPTPSNPEYDEKYDYFTLSIGSNPFEDVNNYLEKEYGGENRVEYITNLGLTQGGTSYYCLRTKDGGDDIFTKINGSSQEISIGSENIDVKIFSSDGLFRMSIKGTAVYMGEDVTNKEIQLDNETTTVLDAVNDILNKINYDKDSQERYTSGELYTVSGKYGTLFLGTNMEGLDLPTGEDSVATVFNNSNINDAKYLDLYLPNAPEGAYDSLFRNTPITHSPLIGKVTDHYYGGKLLGENSCFNIFNNCKELETIDLNLVLYFHNDVAKQYATIPLQSNSCGLSGKITATVFNEDSFNNCKKLKNINLNLIFVDSAGRVHQTSTPLTQSELTSSYNVFGDRIVWYQRGIIGGSGENVSSDIVVNGSKFPAHSVYYLLQSTGLFSAISKCGSEVEDKVLTISNTTTTLTLDENETSAAADLKEFGNKITEKINGWDVKLDVNPK